MFRTSPASSDPPPQDGSPTRTSSPSPQRTRCPSVQPTTTTTSTTNESQRLSTVSDFGRLDSDYTVVDHAVDINGQDTLPGMVYDQMSQLTTIDLPIDRPGFIRVWKTLILKRLQDVFEQEKRVRAQHFVRLARNQLLPAPLADLLHSLGSFHSPATGVIHHMTPPAQAAAPENWWNVDNVLFVNWLLSINRMKHLFAMKEFPMINDYETRPIMLTGIIEPVATSHRRFY